MTKKICTKCGKEKDLLDYHVDNGKKDGLKNKCKKCVKQYDIKFHKENFERIKVVTKKYRNNNKDKIKQLKKNHSQTEIGKKQRRIAQKKYRDKFPEKMIAHNKVNVALKSNNLIKQPCKICGASKVEAHHEDYSRPLDVIWLCKSHHDKEHKSA